MAKEQLEVNQKGGSFSEFIGDTWELEWRHMLSLESMTSSDKKARMHILVGQAAILFDRDIFAEKGLNAIFTPYRLKKPPDRLCNSIHNFIFLVKCSM